MSDARRVARAVAALDALKGTDPEFEHREADQILLGLVPPDVREAYRKLQDRCAWWVTA